MASRRALRVVLAHAPWSARTWRDTTFVAAGAGISFLVLLGLAAGALLLPHVVSLLAGGSVSRKAVTGTVAFVLLAAGALRLTAIQRHRFWALLGVDIPRAPMTRDWLDWRGLLAACQSPAAWQQAARRAAYHLLAAPAVAVGGLLTMTMWIAGVGLVAADAFLRARPALAWPLTDPKGLSIAVAGLSLVLLLTAPWVAAGARRLDTRAALALLGPSRAEELERRVEGLTESRAGVLDAADSERRRIERDLHDGAQRRLVSLAMNLGIARAELSGLPEEARKVIADAHEEAKEALAELRDLVRGLHPAILDDRGLDAALSGIAASAPVPVQLSVNLPARASPTVEAVAYFVVSEALANIAKHAGASHAEIEVSRAADVLHVAVTDDGVGGADPAGGTGLAGLARRAASVDGTFRISSPPGGPTRIAVELPCAP